LVFGARDDQGLAVVMEDGREEVFLAREQDFVGVHGATRVQRGISLAKLVGRLTAIWRMRGALFWLTGCARLARKD
jgi:hypothetical protein